jgi:hypothetical protein
VTVLLQDRGEHLDALELVAGGDDEGDAGHGLRLGGLEVSATLPCTVEHTS